MKLKFVEVAHLEKELSTHLTEYKQMERLPDKPPTSIFFRFFASMMFTVSFPAVGTYRKEMQISPSFSC